MSMFGENNELANDLYQILEDMIQRHGLGYTLDFLGRCLSSIADDIQPEDSANIKKLDPACRDCETYRRYCGICEVRGR